MSEEYDHYHQLSYCLFDKAKIHVIHILVLILFAPGLLVSSIKGDISEYNRIPTAPSARLDTVTRFPEPNIDMPLVTAYFLELNIDMPLVAAYFLELHIDMPLVSTCCLALTPRHTWVII